MEMRQNKDGLYLKEIELDWDFYRDDWEVRSARAWRLCVEEVMKYKSVIPAGGNYLRNVWLSNFQNMGQNMGTPMFWHPLCSPWRCEIVKGLAHYKPYFMDAEDKSQFDAKRPDSKIGMLSV